MTAVRYHVFPRLLYRDLCARDSWTDDACMFSWIKSGLYTFFLERPLILFGIHPLLVGLCELACVRLRMACCARRGRHIDGRGL